ncbi:MAG: Pyruvate, phosphate dikinase [Mycobacterium sp.]|nr:Pyruvate, phosphate dikinase [Mycobacterium sp.]
MKPWHHVLDGSSLPAKDDIGGKAWSLARMHQLGLPCPPAFVLPTHVCHAYADAGSELPPEIEEALRAGVAHLERSTGRQFGGGTRPLLLSVRSGAPVSMPGMMDTVLNLGIDDVVERALAAESYDAAYARDTHRRFVLCYGRIVLKADLDDEDTSPEQLRAAVLAETGEEIPADPWDQLRGAVCAVLRSWWSSRAKSYRRHMNIPDTLGTAVTVQAMVFGNLDAASGTGVLFTRDPLTGAPEPYGEYLPCGQGEEVVSGERTPLPLSSLAAQLPAVHEELIRSGRLLEREAGDIQDIEFTVERGRLYLLQARAAKRAPEAAVRLAVDLAEEGLITEDEALARVTAEQVEQVMRPRLDAAERRGAAVLATGEAACPGVAQGIAVSDADEVERRQANGEQVVFIATTTSPEHVQAMISAVAVCTETGGSTSHAAVVCRGLGRPAVVGCGTGTVAALEGREVTVDGAAGEVLAGLLPLRSVDERHDRCLGRLLDWARARVDAAGLGTADAGAAPSLTDLLAAHAAARAAAGSGRGTTGLVGSAESGR